MKSQNRKFRLLAFMALTGLVLVSCNDKTEEMKKEEEKKLTSSVLIQNIIEPKALVQTGMKAGADGPITPGASVDIEFYAGKGQRLVFATMYGASNDWFFAASSQGLDLYNENGSPIMGDVSSNVVLYDNGTKTNGEEPEDEDLNIAVVPDINAPGLMRLVLAYDANKSMFTLTVTNTSGGTANETGFSPIVWTVSNVVGGELANKYPIFERGKKANAEITAIAEGGNGTPLYNKLMAETGFITPLSPVLIVVHESATNPIFELNKKDPNNGLKEIAQSGDFSKLKNYLEQKDGIYKVYIAGSQPIMPGEQVRTQISGGEKYKVSYVTMYGYSNDWFFGNVTPFDMSYKGDATAKTLLLDDGTALDQFPGAGNAQGLFGGTVILEDKNIVEVDFKDLPKVNEMIKITIE